MAPIVQSSALQVVNGAQSGSVTLSGVTAGNAIVVTASIFSPTANDAPLIKDGSTTLTQVSAYTPGGNYSSAVVAWELNVAAGSHTITVQMTSAVTAGYYDFVVHEVNTLGSTQPSVSTTGTTTGSTLALSGATPSQSGCIIFTAIADDGNGSSSTGSATTPSGYTSLWQEMAGASSQIGAAAYQVQTTAAPISPYWTGLNSAGGAGFAGVAVAFAPSGASTNTATGKASVAPTIKGAATGTNKANGAASVSPTAAGTANNASQLSAAGNAFAIPSASGAATSTLTAAGSSSISLLAAGTALATALAVGAASISPLGTGSAVITNPAAIAAKATPYAAGSATSNLNAAGAATLTPTALGAASNAAQNTANGAATVLPSATGSAVLTLTATGAASVTATASGAASSTLYATGSPSVALTAAGSAQQSGTIPAAVSVSVTPKASGAATSTLPAVGNANISAIGAGQASSRNAAAGQASIRLSASGKAAASLSASGIASAAMQAAGTAQATLTAVGAFSVIPSASGLVSPQAIYSADDQFYAKQSAAYFYGPQLAGFFYAAQPAAYFYAASAPSFFYAPQPATYFYALASDMTTPTFSAKHPASKRVATFDATANLASGETLTSIISTTVTVIRGTDPNPSAVVAANPAPAINAAQITVPAPSGPVTIAAGSAVQCNLTGGLDGTWYLISFVCATSNPNKVLTLEAILPVSAQP